MKRPSKRLRFNITLFCLLLPLSANARTLDEIQKSGILKIATEGTYMPFNFYKKNGKLTELTGFEVELGNELARVLKVKPEWKTAAFGSLLIGLSKELSDIVISSHAITPERAKIVDFIAPHYCSGAVVLAREGGPKTTADLKGKIVGAQISSIYPAFLTKVVGLKTVKTYPTDEDGVQAVIHHKIDATITDQFVALGMIKNNPTAKLQAGEIINPERNAMAVAKGNSSLKTAIETALNDSMNNGFYQKLSQKYFERDVRCAAIAKP